MLLVAVEDARVVCNNCIKDNNIQAKLTRDNYIISLRKERDEMLLEFTA